jgi:carbonic anhydrase
MQAFIHPTLVKLFDGIKNFQQRAYELDSVNMKGLVEDGQHPKILLIACSDSRVDPAILTNAEPGDLFVIRNVANLVPAYDIESKYDGARAAIEYAVRDLEVEHIVILGHARCGGINALLKTLSGQKIQRDFIGDWVSLAMDGCMHYAIEQIAKSDNELGESVSEVNLDNLREHQHLVERAAIRGSLDNLRTYPWIKQRIDTGILNLHGWWFDLESGDLWATDAENTVFLPVIE